MSKTWLVAGYEIRTTFRRLSFLFISFGIPLIASLVFMGIRLSRPGESSAEEAARGLAPEARIEGYVDLAGLVQELPPDLPVGELLAYPSEEQARKALEAGQIQAYYIIPEGYLASGEISYVQWEFNPLAADRQDWKMRWALLYNLLERDLKLAGRVWMPAEVFRFDLSAPAAGTAGEAGCVVPGMGCESNALLRYLPLVMLLIFFFSILTNASLQLRSISLEKENRLIEVMATSIKPVELLAGKLVGFGLLGLIQFAAWMATAYLFTAFGGSTLNLPENFRLPPEILAWGLVFFLLGYALYGSLVSGAGALAPDLKSNTAVSFVIYSPIYVGYLFALTQPYNPHGWLATALSLFPLTSPIVIIWRMVQGGIPSWQPWLAAGLLILTTLLVVRASARMFRVVELLSGQPFQLRRYLKALATGSA